MTDHKVRPKSGDKIINDVGVKAIKNGQKRRTDEQAPRGDKPKWLRFVSPCGQGYQDVKKIVVFPENPMQTIGMTQRKTRYNSGFCCYKTVIITHALTRSNLMNL